jgi:hypothetical protein
MDHSCLFIKNYSTPWKDLAKAVQGIWVPEQACSCSLPYAYNPIGALKIVIYSTKDLKKEGETSM